ncbi:MAG: ricin-type beta-trefoil lectin domain protein [Streptosporangiaceae bacterium]
MVAQVNASGQIVGYGGMCLDVRGPSTADGTPVQIWTCNGVEEEQWIEQ